MFRFVPAADAARVDRTLAAQKAPAGIAVRRGRRFWEITDGAGRVLSAWSTKERAERDAARYRRAAGEGR